jgi:DNA-binding transcriptional regulator LsrR (DeoR family)
LAARTSLSAAELAILEEYLAEPRTIARNRDIITVTQEQIGEILRLTGVHISRTLRRLRHEGLVAIEGPPG